MQQGGSHFGVLPPPAAEAVPPINSRPPPSTENHLGFEELASTFQEEADPPADRPTITSAPGNRWPRHETLALIRIRSDMDAAFREATLKGPLWEEVSRKLMEQGITRSWKKCKEKFENVHKYYKRTKDGRAGRQDGKSYRFFSELEALYNTTGTARPFHPAPVTTFPLPPNPICATVADSVRRLPGILFSSGSESDDTEDDAAVRKRKRRGGTRRTMAMFGDMMRKVMEQQEAMQQRLLDVIEKREQDRMAREEAWKRQEASRLSREHELAAQERSMAASRDAAIISFLQKISEQAAPPALHHDDTPPPPPPPPPPMEFGSGDPASSRWPKAEVLALIDLRTTLDARYHDSGAKGPLWEEISAGMRRLGYSRSAKRCKEKWENINKYFKKVKESNKKRPEDAKTCPYYHQLEEIYRSRSSSIANHRLPTNPSPAAVLRPPSDASSDGAVPTEKKDAAGKPSYYLQDSASISGHDDDDYDDDDDDNGHQEKMAYRIEFQQKNLNLHAAAPTTTTMVQ